MVGLFLELNSFIITLFHDTFFSFRIHNLTAYLQALHKEGLANEDHTILLLNCYTKLKDNQVSMIKLFYSWQIR